MKKVFTVLIALLGVFLFSCQIQTEEAEMREEKLNDFILSELSSPEGGIYTNYLSTTEQLEWATGHEILSESIGLMMLAAYEDEDKKLFQQYSDYLDEYMLLNSGVYAWRILEKDEDELATNATIDDLRIAKAYFLAYEKWGDSFYLNKAKTISNALLDQSVSEGILYNYAYGDALIDLSYLDIETMTLLSSFDQRWTEVKRQSVEIISGGFINEAFPFYHKVYDLEKENYVIEESINMIDPLLVLLHLSEESRMPEVSLEWLKRSLEEGTVYGYYRYGDWFPDTRIESTAVYALIMRIAVNVDDESLYNMALAKALNFQVMDKSSSLYGAFAYVEKLEVFSFDQLQMLLAFRRR